MHKHFQYLTSLQDGPLLTKMCGRDSIQMIPRRRHNVDFSFWEEKWSRSGRVAVKRSPFYVALAVEKYQLLLFQGGRVLIQGTDNEHTALRLYRQWIGS
jgi:molybdopterin-synthase adenylyltransferase